jgi:multiple sugar transport system ATP-binding protein
MNFFPVMVEGGKSGSIWLRHASFTLAVPKSLLDAVRPHVGKEVDFGIRPEDLYDRLFYNYPVLAHSSVNAVVDVVEPMGSEIYLYLKGRHRRFGGPGSFLRESGSRQAHGTCFQP